MAKGSGRQGPAKKDAAPTDETSFIVFSDGKADRKQKARSNEASKGIGSSTTPNEDGPKKPGTRQLIGGTSWTGKLPANLLSEHCQKQKWDKPEYTMVCVCDLYTSSMLTIPDQEIPRVPLKCCSPEARPKNSGIEANACHRNTAFT